MRDSMREAMAEGLGGKGAGVLGAGPGGVRVEGWRTVVGSDTGSGFTFGVVGSGATHSGVAAA